MAAVHAGSSPGPFGDAGALSARRPVEGSSLHLPRLIRAPSRLRPGAWLTAPPLATPHTLFHVHVKPSTHVFVLIFPTETAFGAFCLIYTLDSSSTWTSSSSRGVLQSHQVLDPRRPPLAPALEQGAGYRWVLGGGVRRCSGPRVCCSLLAFLRHI